MIAATMALLELRDIKKGYRSPDGDFQPVLDVPRFDLEARAARIRARAAGR
jgi:hypothetical protein